MSKVASPVTGKPYGLAAVCRAWRIARSGIYRHRTPPSSAPRRRGPMGALSDAALAAAIKAVLAASPFHGEGHRKVWARLRYAGIRTSLRRVLRLMREHDLLAPGRVGSPRGPRSHDGTIVPDTIDTMPEKTLRAFTEHGEIKGVMAEDGGDAEAVLARFAKAGIDTDALAIQLQRDGAQAFVKSWQELMTRIAEKSDALVHAG